MMAVADTNRNEKKFGKGRDFHDILTKAMCLLKKSYYTKIIFARFFRE